MNDESKKEWTVIDNTGTGKGYLTLCSNGVRVCDFFPFAKDADPAWVKRQAFYIEDIMNRAQWLEQAWAAHSNLAEDGTASRRSCESRESSASEEMQEVGTLPARPSQSSE